MIVQNGYGNLWTPAQSPVQAAISDQESTPQELASATNQARTQEASAGARETQTQQRVQAREQAQSTNVAPALTAFEQYQRTGTLSVYA